MPHTLDEIKNRLSLSQLAQSSIQLKRLGADHYIALCPFHNEKTPSFHIYDQKQHYHCFGCSQHGDIFSFFMHMKNVSFSEALRELAKMAGVELSPKRIDPRKNIQEENFYTLLEKISLYYQQCLWELPEAHPARLYLEERNIPKNHAQHFCLGFSPDSQTFLYALKKNQWSWEILQKIGILNDALKPFFWQRLMFPICNSQGQVIAFGGRRLDQRLPKYINSRETILFKKKNTLYNLHTVAQNKQMSDPLYIVEGYTDTLRMHMHGYNAVAPLGTSMTQAHIALLWRYHRHPIVCFDGDSPGQKASLSLALQALEMLDENKNLSFMTLPKDEDPDSLLTCSPQKFKKCMENVLLLDTFVWNHLLTFPRKTTQERAIFEKEKNMILQKITNPYVKRAFVLNFKKRSFELDSFKKKPQPGPQITSTSPKKELYKSFLQLIALILQYPHYFYSIQERFMNLTKFPYHDLNEFKNTIYEYFLDNKTISTHNMLLFMKKKHPQLFKIYLNKSFYRIHCAFLFHNKITSQHIAQNYMDGFIHQIQRLATNIHLPNKSIRNNNNHVL